MSNVESRQVRRARERDGKKPTRNLLDPKAIKASFKMMKKLGPEAVAKIEKDIIAEFGEAPDPVELGRGITRKMVAWHVREKFAGVLKPEDYAAMRKQMAEDFEMPEILKFNDAETLGFIDGENVMEILEHIVHGDAIIDDKASATWFRDLYNKQLDHEIEIDANPNETRHKIAVLNVTCALQNHNVIVGTSANDNGLVVLGDEEARKIIVGPEYGEALGFPDEWQAFTVVNNEGKKTTDTDAQTVAEKIAKQFGTLSVGYFIGNYGNCKSVEAIA
jgi:hypothetical protein